MTDKKISELVAVTTVEDTDEFVLARAGASNKITGANLKVIGTSYLLATTVDAEAIASGFGGLQVPFTLAHQAGTDVAINADPTTIDVLTAGWYIANFGWTVQADDADILRSTVRIDVSSTGIPQSFFDDRGGPRSSGSITTAPMQLDAGATVRVFLYAITTDGGTYSFYGNPNRFAICRVS